VKKLLPLPPFDIEIQCANFQEVYSPSLFEKLDLTLENDYSWDREDNIKIIQFDLNDDKRGFRGKAEMAYISNHRGQILKSLDICQKEVTIDEETFTLSSRISYATNCIHKSTTNIEVDEEGDIHSNESFRDVCKSFSYLSIHGIEVPCNLFRDYTNYGQKAVLEFPFPLRFRLDVGSKNDLNLNSARTQIIYDEIWVSFERQFTETVLSKLKKTVSKGIWDNMKSIFSNNTKNAVFKEIINDL